MNSMKRFCKMVYENPTIPRTCKHTYLSAENIRKIMDYVNGGTEQMHRQYVIYNRLIHLFGKDSVSRKDILGKGWNYETLELEEPIQDMREYRKTGMMAALDKEHKARSSKDFLYMKMLISLVKTENQPRVAVNQFSNRATSEYSCTFAKRLYEYIDYVNWKDGITLLVVPSTADADSIAKNNIYYAKDPMLTIQTVCGKLVFQLYIACESTGKAFTIEKGKFVEVKNHE